MNTKKTDPLVTAARLDQCHGSKSLASNLKRATTKKIVANRMLEARLMNGYSQQQASDLFGYKGSTSTQLSLCERGQRLPPLSVLIRASEIYKVSMDYLTGLCSDPDRDPDAEIRRYIVESTANLVQAQTNALLDGVTSQLKSEAPLYAVCKSVANEGEALAGSLRRFIEANSETFEEMRGGATLLRLLDSFEENAVAMAQKQISRFDRVNGEARRRLKAIGNKASTVSMELFSNDF